MSVWDVSGQVQKDFRRSQKRSIYHTLNLGFTADLTQYNILQELKLYFYYNIIIPYIYGPESPSPRRYSNYSIAQPLFQLPAQRLFNFFQAKVLKYAYSY